MSRSISLSQASLVNANWRKIGLRFAFVYFILLTHLLFIRMWSEPLYQTLDGPWQAFIQWVGKNVFHIEGVSFHLTGSGDATGDYLRIFCYFLLSAVFTLIWSLVDRKGEKHDQLFSWFATLVRLFLGSAMILYGLIKVIPLQFSEIKLHQLLMPYGDSSPMGILWKFMATSKAYTIFTGAAEVVAGIFLLFPALATIGAMLSIGVLSNVFMLNLSYDVPVKLFSFHLLLMSLFLASLEWRRIAQLLVANSRPLFRRSWMDRAFLIFSVTMGCFVSLAGLNQYYNKGALSTKPMVHLQGIWTIEEYLSDGQIRPPLLTDITRWHRIVFESPDYIVVQKVDGKFDFFDFQVDENTKTLRLGKNQDETWKGDFTFEDSDHSLVLTGLLEHRKVGLKLNRLDESEFLLTSRGFYFINDYPVYK